MDALKKNHGLSKVGVDTFKALKPDVEKAVKENSDKLFFTEEDLKNYPGEVQDKIYELAVDKKAKSAGRIILITVTVIDLLAFGGLIAVFFSSKKKRSHTKPLTAEP